MATRGEWTPNHHTMSCGGHRAADRNGIRTAFLIVPADQSNTIRQRVKEVVVTMRRKALRTWIIALSCAVGLAPPTHAGTVLFVDDDAPDCDCDCSSWADACQRFCSQRNSRALT